MRKLEDICCKTHGCLALTQPTCSNVALLDAVGLRSRLRKVRGSCQPSERAGLLQSHQPEDTLRKHLHFRPFDLRQELYSNAHHTLGGRILAAAKMWEVDVNLGNYQTRETPRIKTSTGRALSRSTDLFEGFWWIFLASLYGERDAPRWGRNE